MTNRCSGSQEGTFLRFVETLEQWYFNQNLVEPLMVSELKRYSTNNTL